jgi:alanine dehydrogenase
MVKSPATKERRACKLKVNRTRVLGAEMIIGVPKEIKEGEKRVAMPPQCVDALVSHHHRVLVEKGAGEGSGFSDHEYQKAGATVIEKAEDIWNETDTDIH